MLTKYKFAALVTLLSSITIIVACSSSSSSSSGRGQIPTGQYTGNLNGQVGSNTSNAVPTSTRIILNVIAQLDTTTNPGTISGISGNMVVTGGDRCWSGGTINGSASTTTTTTTNNGTNTTTNNNTDNTTTSNTTNNTQTPESDATDNEQTHQLLKTPTEYIVQVFISEAQAQSVINGDQMTLEIATVQGTLNLSGRVTDDTYKGTFSTDNSDCGPISGGFDLDRV